MVLSSRLNSRTHPAAIFLVALGIAAIMIYPFITSLILAAITTYIFTPIIKKMQEHKLFSSIGLGILTILIGIPIVFVFSYLTTNIGQIFGDITGLSGKITSFISVFSDTISSMGLGTYIDLPLGAKEITANLTSIAIGVVSGFVTSIPILLIDIVIYLFATYYFMRNGNEIICAVKDYASTLPPEDEKFISSIIKGLKKSFDVLIISYIGMAFITSAFSFIGYYIFGVPHAFLLGIITGLFGFLPVFGTWMIYAPTAAYMYYTGNTFAAGGILVFGLVILNFLIPFVLQPYFGSRKADVNQLTLLIGFFSGPIIFGAKGLLLGPIIFVVVQTIIHEYIILRTDDEKNHI